MNTFTAIDFETAQGKRWSVCQVGIVRVENGQVVDTVMESDKTSNSRSNRCSA